MTHDDERERERIMAAMEALRRAARAADARTSDAGADAVARRHPRAGETPGDPAGAPREMPVRQDAPRRTPKKVPVSIRLDADLLDCLKSEGRGWQTRVNAILRKAMGLAAEPGARAPGGESRSDDEEPVDIRTERKRRLGG